MTHFLTLLSVSHVVQGIIVGGVLAFLILFVLCIALQGKSYFLAPAYPRLYAGGALLLGAWRVRWPTIHHSIDAAHTAVEVSIAPSLAARLAHASATRRTRLDALPE